ncbi:DAK2 domain-containing protein [Ferroacidibacillus organovorans]|uniref:DhaL domain-containing protein n=1 Tax=Ferroacidibacillus organovorans TaxID=1765683 RepID=A0A1V4ETA2_9BACL|nr:DAK2 domain-containing protein [Ferroacidibacillus organovorans]OPG16173.1 hypothetical protein B2M26_07610 [Ferroacidibacillus organovorans]
MLQQEDMDGALFLHLLKAGHDELEKRKDEVNALNVFPVPDGDTGTNMFLTLHSGLEHVLQCGDKDDLQKLAQALSSGLLMGARGNSGVILSQLFRGFQSVFLGRGRSDARQLAQALTQGVQIAYKAVARPVEGTILTVAREAALGAEAASRKKDVTLLHVMEAAVHRGEQALLHTPDLLPILRQAGVVDSGGQGLLYIYKGFLQALMSEPLLDRSWDDLGFRPAVVRRTEALPQPALEELAHGEGEFGYCTEFLIRRSDSDQNVEESLRESLMQLGDSLLVVQTDEWIKVHVHTLHPGTALEAGLAFGALNGIKIDNMTEQYAKRVGTQRDMVLGQASASPLRAKLALAAVVTGDGIEALYRGIGVQAIVQGGSTMNPSTEELLTAIKRIHADQIILLPNHKNVIMAAEQACAVMAGKVHVIPALNMGSGLGAALAFDAERPLSENIERMTEAAKRVQFVAITASVRDASYQGHAIEEGDYLALYEGEIAGANPSRSTLYREVLTTLCERSVEICTVFYADESLREEALCEADALAQDYPEVTFEVHCGGQSIYDYLIAAE